MVRIRKMMQITSLKREPATFDQCQGSSIKRSLLYSVSFSLSCTTTTITTTNGAVIHKSRRISDAIEEEFFVEVEPNVLLGTITTSTDTPFSCLVAVKHKIPLFCATHYHYIVYTVYVFIERGLRTIPLYQYSKHPLIKPPWGRHKWIIKRWLHYLYIITARKVELFISSSSTYLVNCPESGFLNW